MGSKGFLGVTVFGAVIIVAAAAIGFSLLAGKAKGEQYPGAEKELVGGVSPLDLPAASNNDRGLLNLRREEVTAIVAKAGSGSGITISEGGMLNWGKAFDILDANELLQSGLAVEDVFQPGSVVHPAADIAARAAGTNDADITGTISDGTPVKRTEYNATHYDRYWGGGGSEGGVTSSTPSSTPSTAPSSSPADSSPAPSGGGGGTFVGSEF